MDRIKHLNSINLNETGKCVLYVMSRDQRVTDNHALIYAQQRALKLHLPLAVVFCLQENTGYRAREHYIFMLEGLRQVEDTLNKLNIPFIMLIGNAFERLSGIFHHTNPESVFFDLNPLIGYQKLLQKLSSLAKFPMYVVDNHNIVPVWVASDKKQVGAYTLRPRIHRLIGEYLVEPSSLKKHPIKWPGKVMKISELDNTIQSIVTKIKSNGVKIQESSGENEAFKKLNKFIKNIMPDYGLNKNNPTLNAQSGLSIYLHFGQLSSLRVALEIQKYAIKNKLELGILNSPKMPLGGEGMQSGIDAFLEELIVRKELADNFCYYEQNYCSTKGASVWAQQTLNDHAKDEREYIYSFEELRIAKTHDNAWNSAQRQLTNTGKMHGYMRMYWAKKILEWTENVDTALEYAIRLNDFYSNDGGDPNGYAGIMWAICGVHDRPWFDRPVYGKIRYMNYAGLNRKFDLSSYMNTWQ